MPRQNRVAPTGDLIVTASRGLLMGNRGVLHNDSGVLTSKRWSHKHWIICQTEFKGRKRELMAPGCYTELFFYDEAVALAAGHRPCAECRREDFNRFKAAWVEGNPEHAPGDAVRVGLIDKVLHAERIDSSTKAKNTFRALLQDLPGGTFFQVAGECCLWWNGRVYPWSPDGYGKPRQSAVDAAVEVLTPRSVVAAIKHGYTPEVRISLLSLPQ